MTLRAYAFPKLQTAKDAVRQISNKPYFRTLSDSQHVNVSQILVESALQQFYQIFHRSEGS